MLCSLVDRVVWISLCPGEFTRAWLKNSTEIRRPYIRSGAEPKKISKMEEALAQYQERKVDVVEGQCMTE
jgi:hypothetical protein